MGGTGDFPGCLRDVPTPRETESECEGPAVQITWRAKLLVKHLREEMPPGSPVLSE